MRRMFPFMAALTALSTSAVTVEVDEYSVGMGTVSWTERILADGTSTLTLKAAANAGYAFSGWRVEGTDADWPVDMRNPSIAGVRVATNAVIRASFVDSSLDILEFDVADVLSEFECGESVNVQLSVDSSSFPSISFQGLPPGLSYDSRTLTVSGTANTPCMNTVVVTGVNGSGFRFSQTFRSEVGDKSTARLSADDAEIELGEYFHAEFEEMFTVEGERMATTVSGFPDGMIWNQEWDLLYGTPRKAGVYIIKAVVRFADGKSDEATFRLTVARPSPQEHGVDVSGLEGLSVGDVIESGDVVLGSYENREGVVSVAGLPAGLSVETWGEDGVKNYGVVGTVLSPGLFTVSVGVVERFGESTTNVTTASDIIVSDTPWRYCKALVSPMSPPGSGKVSGGGAISVVSGATLSASASRGYVFAGWRDAGGEPNDVGEGVDYRNPSIAYGADAEFEFIELYALFSPSEEDSYVSISDLDGEMFEFDAEGTLDEEFSVESVSLPSLSAKGLPAGVSIVPASGSSYRLSYDSETSEKRPSPGRYEAVLTAKNASGAVASAKFLVTVSNIADSRVNVDDDYGEFTPGEEIDPIDLSDAVDFAKGETLSVSGLPRGLSFNKTANAAKGIAANTITGTPTAPGYYTLAFTAKVISSATTNAAGRVSYKYDTAKATAFITVLPWPLLSIDMDEDAAAAGNTVSGGGNYKPGTKVTLKAKSAKGWVFAGWDGLWDVEGLALLNPSLSIVTDYDDLGLGALFVPVADDSLVIYQPILTDSGFAAEFELDSEVADGEYAELISELIETVSYPAVKVSGLPSGVKFSSSTFLLSGKPSKPGVYYVTVAAKNAGGYSFTRILRVAVLDKDGGLPVEPELENAAQIDFSPVNGLVTGVYYANGDVVLEIGPSPISGEMPVKAALSGLPAGLSAVMETTDAGIAVSLVGTPTKVARCAISVKVTYADKKTLTSKAFAVLEDGGSAYLGVRSLDESLGSVSGAGVYAAGETVKLSAKPKSKCVFAGWFADVGMEEPELFPRLAQVDGFDFRTSSVSFPFRPGDLSSVASLVGAFAASSNDTSVAVDIADDVWEIDPERTSEFAFSVDSVSLPKMTAKNLPKGVTIDLARGKLVYTPTDTAKSGRYASSLTAQNLSKASATSFFEIRVANRVCEAIKGLDPDMEAYNTYAGVAVPLGFADCSADDGWTVKAAGLPSGLKFDAKTGEITGVATAKAGSYTVTFTASRKGEKSQVATITINVESLPSWVVGTFDGAVNEGGLVQSLVVAANGKISGKLLTDGLVWTLSAPSFAAVEIPLSDAEPPVFHATVIGKSGKLVITNDLSLSLECGRGVATSGDGGWTAWQNLWKAEPWKTVAKPFAKASSLPVEAEDGIVTLKFASSGNVTAAGRFVTGIDSRGKDVIYSTTCSSVLIPTEADGDSLSTHSYLLYLYFSPKKDKFEGFAAIISLVWDGESFALEGQGD